MLNFLRKIRSQEMNGKYLKYAIGEIFLVIVGILIALAITEWNNEKHDSAQIRVKLLQVSEGLKVDILLLESASASISRAVEKVGMLDNVLKEVRKEYDEYYYSLFGQVFGTRILNLNTAFYEDLKNSGFDLIKNDALRVQLINNFESNYKKINDINAIEWSINEVNRPFYLKNFHDIRFTNSAVPNDIEALWNDRYYKNIVNYRLTTLKGNQVSNYQTTVKDIKKLLVAIENYIE